MMIVKGFAGFKLIAGDLHFRPALPAGWDRVTFKLVVRGNWLNVSLTEKEMTFTAAADNPDKLMVWVGDNRVEVSPGMTVEVQIP